MGPGQIDKILPVLKKTGRILVYCGGNNYAYSFETQYTVPGDNVIDDSTGEISIIRTVEFPEDTSKPLPGLGACKKMRDKQVN